MSKGGSELSTDHNPSYGLNMITSTSSTTSAPPPVQEDNPAYGLNTSQYRSTDSNGEYEMPISTSSTSVEEAVYERIN